VRDWVVKQMEGDAVGFRDSIKNKARFRQWAMCGLCGEGLNFSEEHAHHIIPRAAGGKDTVDNCIVLCDACHYIAHKHGDYRSLVVAPRSYYPYIYGRATHDTVISKHT